MSERWALPEASMQAAVAPKDPRIVEAVEQFYQAGLGEGVESRIQTLLRLLAAPLLERCAELDDPQQVYEGRCQVLVLALDVWNFVMIMNKVSQFLHRHAKKKRGKGGFGARHFPGVGELRIAWNEFVALLPQLSLLGWMSIEQESQLADAHLLLMRTYTHIEYPLPTLSGIDVVTTQSKEDPVIKLVLNQGFACQILAASFHVFLKNKHPDSALTQAGLLPPVLLDFPLRGR